MKKDVLQKVINVLATVSGSQLPNQITPMAKLKDDLGLDSMSSLTFLMALEESIDGFVVDPHTLDLNDLDCVQSITHYVERQLAQA